MTQTPQMPPIHPPEPFDADERELARALRSLPSALPPPELDARILGAARKAVHRAQPRPRGRGWLLGVGTAASALFALGLFFKMQGASDNSMYTLPSDAMNEAPARAPMPGAESRTAKEQAQAATAADAAAPPAAAPPLEAMPRKDAEQDREARNSVDAAGHAAQPVERKQAEGILQPADAKAVAARQQPSAFPEPAKSAPMARPPPQGLVNQPAMSAPAPLATQNATPTAPPAPPAAAAEEQSKRKAESGLAARRDEFGTEGSDTATGALKKDKDRALSMQKPAPAESSAATGSAKAAGGQTARTLDRVDVKGARIKRAVDTEPTSPVTTLTRDDVLKDNRTQQPSPWAGTPASSASASSAERDSDRAQGEAARTRHAADTDPEPADGEKFKLTASVDEDMTLPPSRWLERIRARLHAGYRQGARESLQRFQAHYPDEEIPADLQPLLK